MTRLSNEELARRAVRRAQLSPDTPAESITDEDLALAPSSLVEQWMNAGKLHDRYGVPPQRTRRRGR
jgi:hypothetical protein